MRRITWQLVLCGFMSWLACGCGGGSSPTTDSSTTITVGFGGTQPSAVAQQIGTGPWTTASLQGGKLTVTIPSGTANAQYAIAYVCPLPFINGNPLQMTLEYVIEATPKDGTSYTAPCAAPPFSLGSATGSVNAAAIPGTTDVWILGPVGGLTLGKVGGTNGTFNVNLTTGTEDIAALAVDGSQNLLGVKILRSQTIPGAVNGGNSIVFSANDATHTQPVTLLNAPAGFNSPTFVASYFTAANTIFGLNNLSNSQYAAVSASETQSGDYYEFIGRAATINGSHSQSVEALQTTDTAGPVTLSFPAPLSVAAPVPATFPTFSINYTGFANQTAVSYGAQLDWTITSGPSNTNVYDMSVIATAAYQGNSSNITIPNLTSLAGFLPMAPSGSSIRWTAGATGGNQQWFSARGNNLLLSVDMQDAYTQP